VLLARAVNIEVAKPGNLRGGALELSTQRPAQALIKQQLGVAVNIERALKLRRFAKGVRTAIGGGGRGIQQARALRLAGAKQLAAPRVVVVHHVFSVQLHGVAACAFMKNGFHTAVSAFGKQAVEVFGVDVVSNLQVRQVSKFVAVGQVVNSNDVVDTARVQPFDKVAADKSGCTRDDDFHRKVPWGWDAENSSW